MIIHEKPPNFGDIIKVFPRAGDPGVVFAYGKDIFVPDGGQLPPAILRHEAVHQMRQLVKTPEHWWDQYLTDPEFRYIEELKAHAVEFIAQLHPLITRNDRAKLLHRTAARLIAPLYAYEPPRTLRQAQLDLRKEIGL